MTVQLDTIDNASLRQDAKGVSLVRIARLSAIRARPDDVHRAALQAPGLPRWGDPHPSFPNLRLLDIALEATDVSQWRATLTYREPTPEELSYVLPPGSVTDVEWFSSQVTVDRLYDANGERMFHWYGGNPTTVQLVNGNVVETRIAGRRAIGVKAERADVQIPSIGVRVSMTEAANPRQRQQYIGATNRGYWSGDPPYTWLFVGLGGREARQRWLNSYELIYRADTWELESVIEFNGAPPSDATLGNGITRFRVYPSDEFNSLGFTV